MYKIVPTTRFKKDLKTVIKRGYNIRLLDSVVSRLAEGMELEAKHRDHHLTGDYANCRECHITPDWLLVYQIEQDSLILLLIRTGTHSDLF